jgi:hypothetical protein
VYQPYVSSLCLFFLCGLFFFRGTFFRTRLFRRRIFCGCFLTAAIFGVFRAALLAATIFAAAFFTIARRFAFFASAVRRFSCVVRDIPARALELDSWCGDHRLHFPAAMRTLLQMRTSHRLNLFRVTPALHTLIFVQWHSNSLRSISKRKSIACVFFCQCSARR